MKTTIEIKGYEIVIEETEDGVTVMAVQDGETVEEFTLEGEVTAQDDMDSFGEEGDEEDDFEDADEYEDEMDELGQGEDEFDGEESEEDDDFEDESEEEGEDFGEPGMKAFGEDEEEEDEKLMRKPQQEEGPKMESFGDFVRRTQKAHMGRRK